MSRWKRVSEMGNTLRRNVPASDAQRARYDILRARKVRRLNVLEECELDARAFNVRVSTGRGF